MDDAKAILYRLKNDPESNVEESITKLQLRPTLLDPVLAECLELLTSHYVETRGVAALHTIYTFSRVRGYKLVLQNFPTDMNLLLSLKTALQTTISVDDWKSQYVLLLWLAAVILVPFDLNAIDPHLFESLYELGSTYLTKSGIQRDASSIFMGRLLTRSASSQMKCINEFVKNSDFETNTNPKNIGTLQTLAHVMDRVPRVPESVADFLTAAQLQIETQSAGEDSNLWCYESTSNTRLWLKILGRSALKDLDSFGEFAVSECISLFDSKSSQVRMAAAKYIARVTQRMGMEAVEYVLVSIISSLEDDHVQFASADYWNGALLALAEIVRKATSSSVSQDLLDRLVNNVLSEKALHFVQSRIRNNIGANVRDAACYVCWSLFRSRVALNQSQRLKLYLSLTLLACLDNEVNIRRAASAALHEGLGRFGSSAGDLPTTVMFKLIDEVNFSTVSSIKHCYMTILPELDSYDFSSCLVPRFIAHGVNSANPDIRRLAAESTPKLSTAHIHELIDVLLTNEDELNTHGKLLALGALYANGGIQYRLNESRQQLDQTMASTVNESDLLTEAILRLVNILPLKAAEFLNSVTSEEEHVISAAEHLMTQLEPSILRESIVPVCREKVNESRLFVACLVKLYECQAKPLFDYSIILQSSRVADPQSRALTVQCLRISDHESCKRLFECLNDYSKDRRGDVGAWVREAAVTRVAEVGVPDSWGLEIKQSLWRLASESIQKTRLLSGKTLFRLGLITDELDYDNSSRYYLSLLEQCPENMQETVALGIASSVGAGRASAATINGSLFGLLAYLRSNNDINDTTWIVGRILQIDRSSAMHNFEVLRTLKRITTSDVSFPAQYKGRALAIAYNTTLNVRCPELTILDAIDILQKYALQGDSRAKERLLGLLKKHPTGRIRQRAADALFEVGNGENEVLETVDWCSPGYVHYLKNINII